jgi:hypothetical protein
LETLAFGHKNGFLITSSEDEEDPGHRLLVPSIMKDKDNDEPNSVSALKQN